MTSSEKKIDGFDQSPTTDNLWSADRNDRGYQANSAYPGKLNPNVFNTANETFPEEEPLIANNFLY